MLFVRLCVPLDNLSPNPHPKTPGIHQTTLLFLASTFYWCHGVVAFFRLTYLT